MTAPTIGSDSFISGDVMALRDTDPPISIEDMVERGKAMTLDDARLVLGATEPIAFRDFETGDSVDFRVEDKSGYKTEEYQSLYDGRTYYRQVFVETTGFTFEVTVLAFDGRTGAKLFQETFKDQKEKSRRAADEMVGLFENLFSLENQLLGLFVVREREANRYVFD